MTELEEVKQQLADVKRVFSDFALQVMVLSIEGLADAAIIKQQPMNALHALAALERLSAYAREQRAKGVSWELYTVLMEGNLSGHQYEVQVRATNVHHAKDVAEKDRFGGMAVSSRLTPRKEYPDAKV